MGGKGIWERFSYRHPHEASLQRQAFEVGTAREFIKNTFVSGDDTKLFGLSIFPNYGRRPSLAPLSNWSLPFGTPSDRVHENKIREPYVAKDTYTT